MSNVFKKTWFITVLLILIPALAFGQTIKVEGVVEDENGETLIGVSVMVKDTSTGTVTDLDGSFSLNSVKENATLVFSYIGYQTLEMPASSRMAIRLMPDTSSLDDVVVVAYGTQKKVTITGAVSNVSGDDIVKAPVASLGNALAGRLPGVQSVQYSGLPGDDEPIIRVRGVGSLNSAEPLVLVDGVERPFGQIDPNDVQDISILKDASATAVYGVRGANGVILVTTKRGEEGKARISATASAGIQNVTHFLKMTDSYTYATAYNNAQISDGVQPDKLRFSQEAIQHFKDHDMPKVYPDTDWFSTILKPYAWQEQVNVSASGGNKRGRYYVSAGAFNQDGLFNTFNADPEENFKYRRYNYRANIDFDLTKRSSLSVSIGGRLQSRNIIGGGESELFRYLHDATPMAGYGLDEEGRRLLSDPNLTGLEKTNDGLGRFYDLGYVKQEKSVLNLDLQYKLNLDFITKGLEFKIKGSYNSDYTLEKNRKNSYGTGVTYMATIKDGKEVYIKDGATYTLPYSESKWGNRDWYAETSLNYNRQFGKHNVGALLLYNQSKEYYPSGELYKAIPTGHVGLVGRVTYNYLQKYLVDINMGYNGSENFAPGRRYGFFPSASLGWVPSEEKFWEPLKNVISFLKIRGSIGTVGNDRMGSSRFLYLPGSYRIFEGGESRDNATGKGSANFGTNTKEFLPGAVEESAGNPYVTWETALKKNIGFDIKFFNNRLGITTDFFFENRKDILVKNEAALPSILGQKSSSVNYGKVRNHGYEITMNWNDRIGNVHYSISPSLTFARNEVIDKMEVKQDYDHLYQKGHPVGQPFGYEFFEFYVPGTTEQHYKDTYGADMPNQGAAIKPGDCVYVDLTGDGIIDANDKHAIGYTDIPEYNASLNFNLSWKNFDFSMLWVGATHVNRSLHWYYRPQFGDTSNNGLQQWVYDNSWREDNPDAILPRLTFVNSGHNTEDSSVWLIDSSFLRLKNIEVGYTIQKISFLPGMRGIRLYVSGNNVLTFSKFKANDPESHGGEYGEFIKYPMTRVINFGVKLNM